MIILLFLVSVHGNWKNATIRSKTTPKAKLKMAHNLAATRPTPNWRQFSQEKNQTVLLIWFADGDQNLLEKTESGIESLFYIFLSSNFAIPLYRDTVGKFLKLKLSRIKNLFSSCWLTHNRTFEKTAAGIIFDNTKHLSATKGYYNGLPDYKERNLNHQYWVWWPREAASKGFKKGTDLSVVKYWDGAFNLTASYRRDSDITRHWGSVDQLLYYARFSGEIEISFETHIQSLMSKKTKQNHTAWFVSNCDHTNGANARWDYAQILIRAGLKLDGYGECFNRKLRNGPAPWTRGGLLEKYKFYLSFENSIHCNDYISEKFWRNALGTGAVPIVFGPWKQDVIDVAPKLREN